MLLHSRAINVVILVGRVSAHPNVPSRLHKSTVNDFHVTYSHSVASRRKIKAARECMRELVRCSPAPKRLCCAVLLVLPYSCCHRHIVRVFIWIAFTISYARQIVTTPKRYFVSNSHHTSPFYPLSHSCAWISIDLHLLRLHCRPLISVLIGNDFRIDTLQLY